MRLFASQTLALAALAACTFVNGGTALAADRIEYNDFTCEGVMPGEEPRAFSAEVVALPEPADRYLKVIEAVGDAPRTIWEGDLRTGLIISGRGIYLKYEEAGLRFEVFISAADQATQTFPAYLAVQNQADDQDMIVIEQMTCHVTSPGPGDTD